MFSILTGKRSVWDLDKKGGFVASLERMEGGGGVSGGEEAAEGLRK